MKNMRKKNSTKICPFLDQQCLRTGCQTYNEILNEFDSLRERFKNVDSMSKEEVTQFDKALTRLRNKMFKADIGGSYSDHLMDMKAMGDKTGEVLKKMGP